MNSKKKKKKSVKNINPSKNNSKAQIKEGKNYLEEEAKYWSKDYTNEHIREQIKENSQMFSLIIGILVFALFIILLSFFIAYIKKHRITEYGGWL